jgi:hypothetical protein
VKVRLSPQDIDRLENESLDRENIVSSSTLTPPPMYKSRQHVEKSVPPLRNDRHGWKPTLDDMERK